MTGTSSAKIYTTHEQTVPIWLAKSTFLRPILSESLPKITAPGIWNIEYTAISIPKTNESPPNSRLRKTKIVNYYNPNDEVLCEAVDNAEVRDPLGLGTFGKTIPKYVQKRARSKNHRFASYALTLGAFP